MKETYKLLDKIERGINNCDYVTFQKADESIMIKVGIAGKYQQHIYFSAEIINHNDFVAEEINNFIKLTNLEMKSKISTIIKGGK